MCFKPSALISPIDCVMLAARKSAVKLRVQPDFFSPRPDLYPVCEGLMGQTAKVKQLWYYLLDSGFAGIRVCNILAE
jgi:hypothetical protein